MTRCPKHYDMCHRLCRYWSKVQQPVQITWLKRARVRRVDKGAEQPSATGERCPIHRHRRHPRICRFCRAETNSRPLAPSEDRERVAG